MNDKLKRISQVGIIVKNREEAIEGFEKYLGIPKEDWNITDTENFPPLEVNGVKGVPLNIHIAIVTFDNGFEIELIEPIGEGPFMDHLREHGPGVHHFAMVMPDKNARFQELADLMQEGGIKPWIHAKMIDIPGGMDFTYMDAREQMGCIIEMYNEPRE